MKERDSITETLMHEFPDDTEAYRDLNANFRSILADWYRRDAFRMGRMWLILREKHPESFRSLRSSEQITQAVLDSIPEEEQLAFMEQHPELLHSIYAVSNGIHGSVVRLVCRMISENNVEMLENTLNTLDHNPSFRYTDAFFEELLHYPFASFTMPMQSLLIKRGGARIRSIVEEAAYRSRRVKRSSEDSPIQQMIRIGMQYKDRSAAQFIAQTEFMKDYIPHKVPEVRWNTYSIAFPAYSGMSRSQLEWYFYWVSEWKQGHYMATSPEYSYLYAFTLMNGIGAENEQDAFAKLCQLYRQKPDYHLLEWIHDYAVYYKIDNEELRGFLAAAGLDDTFRLTEAARMLRTPQKDTALEIALKAAQMPVETWKQKPYYGDLADFFCKAVVEVRKAYEERTGKDYIDLWTGKPYPKVWTPGEDIPVAYPPAQEGEERRVNDYESYRYLNQRWVGWHYYGADKKWIRKLITYSDIAFRKYTGIAGRRSAKQETDVWFTSVIDRAAKAYAEEKQKPKINMASLENIRSKADRIRERLIIEEEMDEPEEQPDVKPDDSTKVFTGVEEQVLRYLLDHETARVLDYARSLGTMPQVLYETINEKALEWMDDILIEDGMIFEEYRETLEEYLQGGPQ